MVVKRLRQGPTGCRDVHRCHHVLEQGGRRRHAAPDRGPLPRDHRERVRVPSDVKAEHIF